MCGREYEGNGLIRLSRISGSCEDPKAALAEILQYQQGSVARAQHNSIAGVLTKCREVKPYVEIH